MRTLRRGLGVANGHVWTLAMHFARQANNAPLTDSQTFTADFCTLDGRAMQVRGLWNDGAEDDTLFIVLHGIGSNPTVPYVRGIAKTLRAKGAVLRLALRGSDGHVPDFYHGGLTEDLAAAIGCKQTRRFKHICLVGFSLGGHIALRYGTQAIDPRVKGIAAISPPLSLGAGQARLDQWFMRPYRSRILAGLRETYAQCEASRRPGDQALPVQTKILTDIDSIKDWDQKTVVPRFGFASADDYYRRASVGSAIASVRVPSLIVAARYDPIVPFSDLEPYLNIPIPQLEIKVVDQAGHVGFSSKLSLGRPGALGLNNQVLSWLIKQLEPE